MLVLSIALYAVGGIVIQIDRLFGGDLFEE
jgi:hypothetical protein